jgi:hypothetical protein
MKTYPFSTQLKALALILCLISSAASQAAKAPAGKGEASAQEAALLEEKVALIADLHGLEAQAARFDDPLSKALAKAEIADAAWQLDRDWAKKLLRDAYESALPPKEDGGEQNRIAGSIPHLFTSTERSRWKVRSRVLGIAQREKDFADHLLQLEKENLGAYGKHFASASLADQALGAGDVETSAGYILQGIKADPTQSTAPAIINDLAMRDRAAADRLILSYLDELRKFPLSTSNQSDIRVFFILNSLIKPYLIHDPKTKVPPPGPQVIKASLSYMLDALGLLEQNEPGYLQKRRGVLLSLWMPLQQNAPELANKFLSLESISRGQAGTPSLPTATSMEEKRRAEEKKLSDALDSDQPAEATVMRAISKGEFAKARKMIEKLPDGAKKDQLSDAANAEESLSLATKGNLLEAESLAEKLNRADSILKAYSVLISKCSARKDQICATRLVSQAIKQVKTADTAPTEVLEGIPTSAVETDQFFDPVLSSIAKLAIAILPSDNDLAFNVTNELVSVANASPLSTDQTRIGFDINLFKKLAPKNVNRAQEIAYAFVNPIQRVLALAVINQWKAQELIGKQAKRSG